MGEENPVIIKQAMFKSKSFINKFLPRLLFFGIPAILAFGFYGYLSLPYLDTSQWIDIEMDGLKVAESASLYNISGGILEKDGISRKIKFEIAPQKLLENNKVLRLALFYQINKEDPIFYGPGLDTGSYSKALEKLESVNDDLVRNMELEDDLVPLDFLQSAGKVLAAYEDLEKDKSLDRAQNLIATQEEATVNYKKDATTLRTKINELFGENKYIIQGGSVSTTDIMTSDLDKIIKNSDLISNDIQSRETCLASYIFCKRPKIESMEPIKSEKVDITYPSFLDTDELYFTKDLESSEIEGPYELSTSCWNEASGEPANQYLYEIVENIDSRERLIPKIATTNYYQEISLATEETVDIGYKNHDLDWRVAFLTTPYTCNDLTYQSSLATMNYYRTKSGPGLFSIMKDDSEYQGAPEEYQQIIDAGQKSETAFIDANVPTESDFLETGGLYRELYRLILEKINNGETVPTFILSKKDEILDRQLLIEGRLASFDGVLNFYSYILDGYSQMALFYDKGEKDSYIYTARNGYSLLFWGFSPSVWRSQEKLEYIATDKPQLREGLLNREEMIRRFGESFTEKVTHLTREQVWYELLGHYIK